MTLTIFELCRWFHMSGEGGGHVGDGQLQRDWAAPVGQQSTEKAVLGHLKKM